MDILSVLLGLLIIVAIVLCGIAIWGIIRVVETARSVRTLADDLEARLVPLVDKADVTIDAVNAELLRIDGIVSQFEEVGERLGATTRTVRDITNAPAEFVGEVAERVRDVLKRRKSRSGEPQREDLDGN
ncbi:MAG: hypothetical protein AB2L09_02075 [Coriobacteriia bacterium]